MTLKSLVTMSMMLLLTLPATADTIELTARPEKCISLRKGQMCYQTVTLRWQAGEPDDYCLWSDINSTPLQCWNNTDQGSMRYEFAAKNSVSFFLTTEDNQERLARTDVMVAWVYKNRAAGRPRWRLF